MFLTTFTFLFSLSVFANVPAVTIPPKNCSSSREFITVLEFLRSNQKTLGVPEPQARTIADELSAFCSGSAGRFVRLTELLTACGVRPQDAVSVSLSISKKSDDVANAFSEVFRHSYSADALDMNVANALALSRSLALDMPAGSAILADDFQSVAKYCISQNGVDLPRPRCGDVAAQVARAGAKYNEKMSKKFITLFEYLREHKSQPQTSGNALDVALQVIAQGPEASDNFKTAYEYALSESGLSIDRKGALEFGLKMAKRSIETPVVLEEPLKASTEPQNLKLKTAPGKS